MHVFCIALALLRRVTSQIAERFSVVWMWRDHRQGPRAGIGLKLGDDREQEKGLVACMTSSGFPIHHHTQILAGGCGMHDGTDCNSVAERDTTESPSAASPPTRD